MDILKPKATEPPFSESDAAEDAYRRKRIVWKVAALVVLLLAVLGALSLFGLTLSASFPSVSSADWQAVFLTNNQVYFGHLQNYGNSYVVLKDIYYLRAAEPLQQGAQTSAATLNLVKLGAELHGPEDIMYVPKSQIMFWENLRKDSQVVQAIVASQPKK